MTMTIMAAAKEVASSDQTDMAVVCKCISSGSLRGARGNSGVILSQLLRGFTKVVKDHVWLEMAYTYDRESAESFRKEVQEAFPGYEIHMDPLALSVSCHIGPGALAIACSEKIDL